MTFIHHIRWNTVLQPMFYNEYIKTNYETMGEYLHCWHHEFTSINDSSNYGIKLYFKEADEEIIFRLKYL